MKLIIRILNVFAYLLIIMQIFGYLGYMKNNEIDIKVRNIDDIAAYFGFNFFVILALALLYISYKLRKKLIKKSECDN